MKIKLLVLLLIAILVLSGCRIGGIQEIENGLIARKDSLSTPSEPLTSNPEPEFKPYVYIYEVIGRNDNAESIKIPIEKDLITKINGTLTGENEIKAELDKDIWSKGGEYTDETYSWIGLDLILTPDAQDSNSQWALLVNPKAEGVLCDYWDQNDERKTYVATDICNEIIALAEEALLDTEYGEFTKFTLINEVRDIVKVESYERYGGTRLKGFLDKDTMESLEKLLKNSIDGSIGATAMSISNKPYYSLKLTRKDDKEFILQFAPEEYMFRLNNWMVYIHKSKDFYAPMNDLMEILGLDEQPRSGCGDSTPSVNR